jgi:NAD(P)-dependent dehydrogenase (short-subunit alcohol dehydrogenase family)
MNRNQQRALVAAGIGAALAVQLMRRKEEYSFKGKVVLITGGSRGLGLVLARQFAEQGAKIAIIARDGEELARAERDLREMGADVLAFPCDVRVQEEAQSAVERVVNNFGRIDVLINNAGVIQVGPVEHMQVSDFEDAMATHTWGPLYTMLAAVPHMREQGEGRIVNISSIGGRVSVPHLLPYCTSKFALVGLSDGMRAELAKDNIKVTTVCPGLMRAGSHVNSLFKGQHEAEFTWFAVFDSLPLASIDVRRAAHQIIEVCRKGTPHLTISFQAAVIGALNGVAPNLVAVGNKVFGRVLPGPTENVEGDETRTGWESQSKLAPSILTRLNDQATERNNELNGHAPLTS